MFFSTRSGSPRSPFMLTAAARSEEHTSELQSQSNLVCRLLLEKKKFKMTGSITRRVSAGIGGARRTFSLIDLLRHARADRSVAETSRPPSHRSLSVMAL